MHWPQPGHLSLRLEPWGGDFLMTPAHIPCWARSARGLTTSANPGSLPIEVPECTPIFQEPGRARLPRSSKIRPYGETADCPSTPLPQARALGEGSQQPAAGCQLLTGMCLGTQRAGPRGHWLAASQRLCIPGQAARGSLDLRSPKCGTAPWSLHPRTTTRSG